jgi:hypothetical protein
LRENTEVVYLWNFLPRPKYRRWIFHSKLATFEGRYRGSLSMELPSMAQVQEVDIPQENWQHLREDTEAVYLWNFLPWSKYSKWIFHRKLTFHTA